MVAPPKSDLMCFADSFGCSHLALHEQRAEIVSKIISDEASTFLLIAYLLTSKGNARRTRSSQDDITTSIEYRSRGQDILLQRLLDVSQASSDMNIQAVLILVALVGDFGESSEVNIHINGLRNIVNQRGGLARVLDPTLQRQLRSLATSKKLHLTLECPFCDMPVRFTPEQQAMLQF